MKSYLTVDIDFFNYPGTARKQLKALLTKAFKRRIPILAVMNHQQLLKEVNSSEVRRLVNVDAHSDLTAHACVLECGTWVSYVRWRKAGSYLWCRCDKSTHFGSCNGRVWNAGTDWAETKTIGVPQSYDLARILDKTEVVGIGIALSPSFSKKSVYIAVRELIREYSVPYRKGVRHEYKCRVRRYPPGRERHGKEEGYKKAS